ncbi:MAG: AarF/ABC1/UbiB kinase family protein, partial [Candidatus Omnitrophica bacterium]|nr:AarF/ABC1/UbiB kinase family protein [Candidatus Omnitrophota bacterium]
NIRAQIEIDLEIMMHLAEWAEGNIEELKYRRPTDFVEEFAYAIERELDYQQEEANIQRFEKMFRDDPRVHIMGCHPELSTTRVLTMERIEGVKVGNIAQLDQEGYDRKVLADRGVDCVLTQIFDHGFFHADPHPGNIFALKDNVVSFVDFGMVGRLNRRHRELMADFLYAVNQRDAGRAVKFLGKITDSRNEAEEPRLEKEVGELIDRYVSKPLKEVSFTELFARLSELLSDHRMIIPADFSMMLKSISTLEGVGRSLDPDINLSSKLAPYLYRLRIARFRPTLLAADASEMSLQFLELFREIPEKTRDFLEQVLKGESQLRVEHRASDSFEVFWNRLFNRLSVAVILSALLIGSSIIVLSGLPPKWHDIPVIGVVGFVLAGLMSLSLLFSIWRSGKI